MDSGAPLAIGSPWTPYGLRDDPYFQAPLELGVEGATARPLSLFVGRDHELVLLANQVVGASSSRAIIEGDAGVGKTSFVNRLKSALTARGVLTHTNPVRVQPGMSARQFIGEVLKILLQIHATVEATLTAATSGVSRGLRKAKQIAGDETGIGEEAKFWRRVGRLIAGEDSVAGGFTAASVGVQRERVRIPAEVELSLFDELRQALTYLSNHGERRVLLHVNNMENLTREDAAQAAGLIQEVRDCFLADYGHWIFVGTTGITQAIFDPTPQVSSIIPFQVPLGPLSSHEVAELLARRYRHLHLGEQVAALLPPVSPEDGAQLYDRYHGHLRAFLTLLSRAVQRRSAAAPGVPLTVADITETMAPLYWPDLVRRAGQNDAEQLRRALSGQGHATAFRVTDLEKALTVTQAAASKLMTRLEEAQIVAQSHVSGRSTYYRIQRGDDTIALQML
jgi:hypothetical protein